MSITNEDATIINDVEQQQTRETILLLRQHEENTCKVCCCEVKLNRLYIFIKNMMWCVMIVVIVITGFKDEICKNSH